MIWQNFSTFRNVLLNYFKFPWIVLGLFVGGLAKLSRWPLKNWNNEIGETEEVNKSMVEGEILYSVSVFSTKYFFGRHLESLLQGMAQWKGCCILVLGEEPWDAFSAPLLGWTILSHCNICQYVLGSKLPWIDKLLCQHIRQLYICLRNNLEEASNYFFWLRTLLLLLSIYAKCYHWKEAPWITRKPLMGGK